VFEVLFTLNDGSGCQWYLKYFSDLQILVVDKFPDDGTLVPKHAEVGT